MPFQTGKARGLEDMDTSDAIQPRIVLLQALNPVVVDSVAKAGEFMNNISNKVYGSKVVIQPIKYFKTRIKWIDRNDGGGIECRADDGKVGTSYGSCKECQFRQWSETPPECDEIHNFLSIIRDDEGGQAIAIVSFSKTNWKPGKQFLSKIADDVASYGRDVWAKKYTLSSKSAQNDKGQKYFIMDTDSGGIVTEKEFSDGEKAYVAFQNVSTFKVKYDEEEEYSDDDISG